MIIFLISFFVFVVLFFLVCNFIPVVICNA